jgi:hypothetical protein
MFYHRMDITLYVKSVKYLNAVGSVCEYSNNGRFSITREGNYAPVLHSSAVILVWHCFPIHRDENHNDFTYIWTVI